MPELYQATSPGYSSYDWGALINRAREGERGAMRTAANSRNRFSDALYGFSPMQYMQQAGGSIFSSLSEQFGREESARRAGMNRAGMLRSGIGNADALNSFNERLARAIAGLSMQGGQMEQERIGMMGGLYNTDLNQQNRFYDAATGLSASLMQQRNANMQANRNRRAALWGAGIGAAGNILSGGIDLMGQFGGAPPAGGALPGAPPGGDFDGFGMPGGPGGPPVPASNRRW